MQAKEVSSGEHEEEGGRNGCEIQVSSGTWTERTGSTKPPWLPYLPAPVWELVSLHIGALLDILSLHSAALLASVGLVGPLVPW